MIDPLASSAGRGPTPSQRFGLDAMACTFEVLLVEEDATYAERAARAALSELDRIEQALSRFVPSSDIARINALQPGQSVRVGIEAIECLQLAARLYEETAGVFDVTFGSAGVGARPKGRPPLLFDPETRSVGPGFEGVRVDLGGIGKGYALDQMITILRDWNVGAALVHCGQSTVFALGTPPGAAGWSIAIRDPLDHDKTLGTLNLRDVALSGSGRQLHGDHIVDPRNGRPVDDKLGTWALAPSAALSDALSTAFMVMSADEIAEYCRRHADVSGLAYAEADGKPTLSCFGEGVSSIDLSERA